MQAIEIIVIIAAVLVVVGVISRYVYKRITKQPTGECACCKTRMKKNLKKISKELKCECNNQD